jgi:transposase
MDNSKIHLSDITKTHLLSNPEKDHRFHRVFLPTYSPWLNPIERFWRFMRRRLTHDYFFETLRQLKRAAINFCPTQ